VEIVTEPDFRTPHHAAEFLKALRTQVRYVGASECSMENGTMRVDANISIRPKGTNQMNTKVEVKNINSIRHVSDAIAHEINRQSAEVQAGKAVVLHTRLWDPDKKVTLPMRAKFEGPCVPDPAVKDRSLELNSSPVTPARFAALLKMLSQDEINANAAREVLTYLFDSDETPEAIVNARGFKQVSDAGDLEAMIDKVLAAQAAVVADFRAGQGKALGFLIGQVMQASGGKANPKMIRELLMKKLNAAS